MSASWAFAQGSGMAAWVEDMWYEEPDERDDDYMTREDIAEEMAEREWDDENSW